MIDTIKRHEVDRVMNNQNELMQSTREMKYVDLYICMCIYIYKKWLIRIGCVMVSMLASSAVDHEFESQSGQIKDY